MARTVMVVLTMACVLALIGCSGAKKVKQENLDLRARIDSLSGENAKLGQDIQAFEKSLQEKDAELQAKVAELQQKEVLVQEQSNQFAQMQAAMRYSTIFFAGPGRRRVI